MTLASKTFLNDEAPRDPQHPIGSSRLPLEGRVGLRVNALLLQTSLHLNNE